MIEIKNLSKKYDDRAVVDNISFTIKDGSIYGFLGPNGAGKTTTLKLIVGLSEPTSGTIKFNGKKINKNVVGYMPEDPYFYERLTASEFLTFMYELFPVLNSPHARGGVWGWWEKKIPNSNRNNKIQETLTLVGLNNVADKKIADFSKGMKQRLGLAQAIINNPDYLFLDEPLDGLDPIGRIEFKEIILKLKSQGKTIFFNSHVLADVEEICDEIGILNKGKLIYTGSVSNFAQKDGLEKKFVEVVRKADLR